MDSERIGIKVESQQYPAASQAGPQAYFLNSLVDESSQLHSESAVGFRGPEHGGHLPTLAQQELKAVQAGPQAYLRSCFKENEQTQALFLLIPFEQNSHSRGTIFIAS